MTENNRIVNQLIISMDSIRDDIIMICASNLPDCIDKAIMRRFNVVHEILSPTMEEKKQYLQYMKEKSNFECLNSAIDLESIESFAAVEEAFFEEVRQNMPFMYN